MKMKQFLLTVLPAVFLSSCSINVLNNITANPGISFQLLKQDSYGGRENESTVIVKSQTDLDNLYRELGGADAPHVDFEHNNVVALFMGQKNSGGYSISVKGIKVTGDTTTVTVQRTEPNGMAVLSVTSPYCISIIPKTDRVVIE